MADVTYSTTANPFPVYNSQSSISIGQMIHLPNGKAGWLEPSLNSNASLANGKSGLFKTDGVVTIPKPTSIEFRDGVDVFWSVTGLTAAIRKTTNTQDFYAGIAYGNASLSATGMSIEINAARRWDFDIYADETIPPVIVGTQGLNTMGVFNYGNASRLILGSTNEAQKMDMLSVRTLPFGARMLAVMEVNVKSVGSGGAPDFNIALGNGTNATDFDSVTQAIGFHVDGNSTTISAFSRDGTSTPVAITSTTKTLTAGVPFLLWLDMSAPSGCLMYVEGVGVLTGSTFNVSNAASAWQPIVHLEKTAAADTFEVTIPRFSVFMRTQGVQTV